MRYRSNLALPVFLPKRCALIQHSFWCGLGITVLSQESEKPKIEGPAYYEPMPMPSSFLGCLELGLCAGFTKPPDFPLKKQELSLRQGGKMMLSLMGDVTRHQQLELGSLI